MEREIERESSNPRDLPVWSLEPELRRAWSAGNRLVLVAPTGSGKTTQICQMILSAGRNHDKQIVVLQPRRVAARTVARRVAQELGVELGREVGYQVRFEDHIAPETQIAFVTEGILLRWLQDDPTLSRIGAVLFDEFHERNLLSDISLAIVKQLQQLLRPDLLLMVMSATLEAAPVATYLGDCPILESQGRTHPVEIHYQSWPDDRPIWEQAAAQVAEIMRHAGRAVLTPGATRPPQDILVFMPGAYEIQRTLEELRHSHLPDDTILIPLHGELSPRDQDRAFISTPQRRVIVSTNVAETSVTLPNIRCVVDSGQARIARYDHASGAAHGVSTLHVEPISQASADQRAGRAGRVAPGDCYRLWTAADHEQRPARNTPEIQRTELSEVALLLHSFGIAGAEDAEHFDFLDHPDPVALRRAELLLETLGAVTPPPRRITEVGRQMLRLPVHPRYARMLIEARRYDVVREVALFASLVAGRDLLTRIDRNDKIAQRNRETLVKSVRNAPESDYFLLAAAFDHAAKHNFDYKSCYSYGINPHVAKEVALTFQQMLRYVGRAVSPPPEPIATPDEDGDTTPNDDAGQAVSSSSNPTDAIQRCHLVGFVDQLALRLSPGSEDFELAGGRRVTLMQESVIRRSPLIVVSEIREITTRQQEKLTLIGTASAVKPEWLRELQPPGLSEQIEYVYDRLGRRVIAARVMRYHNLPLSGEPISELDPTQVALALAREFVRNPDPRSVPNWNAELIQWLTRVRLAHATTPDSGLPIFDDDQVTQALARAWHGAATFKDIADRPLLPAFQSTLTPVQLEIVDQLAPDTITFGSRILKLQYQSDGTLEAAIRLTDLFGITAYIAAHPAIANNQKPVRLRLIAPDAKVIAATEDFPRFMQEQYPQLRPALRKRYPTTDWP